MRGFVRIRGGWGALRAWPIEIGPTGVGAIDTHGQSPYRYA